MLWRHLSTKIMKFGGLVKERLTLQHKTIIRQIAGEIQRILGIIITIALRTAPCMALFIILNWMSQNVGVHTVIRLSVIKAWNYRR